MPLTAAELERMAQVEQLLYGAFDMSRRGSSDLLAGEPAYDPEQIGAAIAGRHRWELLGTLALRHLGIADAQWRLRPEGVAFMTPVYMLSATWLREADLGLEALGDLFIPPYDETWTSLRALGHSFPSRTVDAAERSALAESVTAYREFVDAFSPAERAAIAGWLEFFASDIYPEYFARPSLARLKAFWLKGDE